MSLFGIQNSQPTAVPEFSNYLLQHYLSYYF